VHGCARGVRDSMFQAPRIVPIRRHFFSSTDLTLSANLAGRPRPIGTVLIYERNALSDRL
jgi:hypothetical protein